MTKVLDAIHRFVWGAPALVLILGVGLMITAATDFAQVRLFPSAVRRLLSLLRGREKHGLRALCTALGATVGTGNLVGVAGAVCIGGPGSVFWIWICGFLGMATKYAEATLAVYYRERTPEGYAGGPMYMIRKGLGCPWLAGVYSLLGVIASFGVGNATQINAVIAGVDAVTGNSGLRTHLVIGILLAVLTGILLLGGASRVGRALEGLVPLAAGGYILLCIGVLLCRYDAIGPAFGTIFRGAFRPEAVTGGVVCSALQAVRTGCARGVFTNEAGMGTAAIAHGTAPVDHPVQQGMLGIVEVFLDTIVICTLTALVILCSGVEIPYGVDAGGVLTLQAFEAVCGKGASWLLGGFLCCFALATLLGWGVYGGCCARFLFGNAAWRWFAMAQAAVAVFGAVLPTPILWTAAEAVNGLMAIPNLLALAALVPQIRRLTIEYIKTRL